MQLKDSFLFAFQLLVFFLTKRFSLKLQMSNREDARHLIQGMGKRLIMPKFTEIAAINASRGIIP